MYQNLLGGFVQNLSAKAASDAHTLDLLIIKHFDMAGTFRCVLRGREPGRVIRVVRAADVSRHSSFRPRTVRPQLPSEII